MGRSIRSSLSDVGDMYCVVGSVKHVVGTGVGALLFSSRGAAVSSHGSLFLVAVSPRAIVGVFVSRLAYL